MDIPAGDDDAVEANPCQPFLKWPGGKRWLAPTIAGIVGGIDGTYYEPFLGGGAVYFHLRPTRAVLSDTNKHLTEVYRQVRTNVEAIIGGMRGMRRCKATYERVRRERPRSAVGRTVRFLYLNRTAFNGMYRVNRKGEFNVPYGCKPGTVICDRQLLRAASSALEPADIHHGDFGPFIGRAGRGDVVYCDPPYTVMHDNNGFIRYNESLFSWDDQVRLAEACHAASERGARVIVSNACHEPVRKLYKGFVAEVATRKSMISGKLEGRGSVAEYLLFSRTFEHTSANAPKRRRRLGAQEFK